MADIKTKTTVLSVDVNDAVRRTGEYKTKIDELRRSLQGLKEDSEEYNRVARELNETIAGLNASLNASSSGNMDKLGRSLQNVSAQVNDTTKTIQNSNLAGRIAELRQQMNEAGEFSSVREYKEYLDLLKASLLNLDETSEEYVATANELHNAQDRLNRVMQASKGYADAADGSYNQLVRTMSELKREWRATADEEERAQLGKKILDINDQLKEMDASIGNYQRNVGDYQNAFEEAFKVTLRSIGANSSALGKLSSQIIQMIPMIKKATSIATTGLRGVKAALASTGIGALVVALGLVVSHWSDIYNWTIKTLGIQNRVNTAVERQKRIMENIKTTVDASNSALEHQIDLLAAAGASTLTQLLTRRAEVLSNISDYTNQLWNLENHIEIFKNSAGISKKERKAWEERKQQLKDVLAGYETTLNGINKAIEVATEKAKKDAQDVADAAAFALLSPAEQLTKTYEKQKAELEKYHVDTTALTKKYLQDLANLSKKFDTVKIKPFEIDTKSSGDFSKIEDEILAYLDWYQNEYGKTEEEVLEYRRQRSIRELEIAKENDIAAAKTAKDTYTTGLKERLEKGEITQKDYNEASRDAAETLQQEITKIFERYSNLRKQQEVKNGLEATIEMNKIYLKRAKEFFNEMDKGWAQSYENQIYRLRQFQDAVNDLGVRGRRGFFGQKNLVKGYTDELGSLRLELEKSFGIFYNQESGMIENHIALARQMTQEHINSIRKENKELQEVLDSSTASFEQQQEAAIKLQVNLSVIDQHMRELETLKVSENSEEVLNTVVQAYAEVVKRIQDFNSIPPLDIENFFDDNQITEYFSILQDEENNIYITRANQIQDTITKLKEQAALMTDGSEERLETERLIAEAEKELSDTTTEHILNNMKNRDDEEQKLLENREKRVQYWKESVEGISTTLSNLGNIFENELKREVDAKEISVEAAKERYESLKALNYAAVVMDTSSAIMSAWKSAMEMPQPYGSIWGGIQTAALLTQGYLQLQQIKNQQFSASSSETPGVTATPTQADYEPQYTANMTSNSELTELTNALNKRKLFVSVTDIEDTEKMVQARDSESTY